MIEDTWIGCTPDGKPPVVGKAYKVIHSRKGEFFGVVKSTDDTTWATLVIVEGVAKAIMSYNVKYEGEEVTVRSSLCKMIPTEVQPNEVSV